jgi:phosphoribosylglycinamide formyltransferase-1
MTTLQRWAIITSDQIRHRYLVDRLIESAEVAVLVIEPKSRNPASNHRGHSPDRLLLTEYFDARERSEARLLGHASARLHQREITVIAAPKGGVNNCDVTRRVQDLGITHCLVFGASWLKRGWLSAFPDALYNLHLGLSPYYRGVATNFWPLHDGLPEYVGATIHRIDPSIDTGPILFQVRPIPNADDDSHSLGNKTIVKAVRAISERLGTFPTMPAAPTFHEAGATAGKQYLAKDFDARALREMLRRQRDGMIGSYASDLHARARAVALVNEFEPIHST